MTKKPQPVQLTKEAFYKVKSALAEARLGELQAREYLQHLQTKINEAMTEAGLDPIKVYSLDETSFSATVKD